MSTLSTLAPAAPATGVQTAQKAGPQSADRAQLRKAAQGFEAIFVRQMLTAARAATLGGSDALFGSQAQETFATMRDERFAEIAATTGAFGLAKQLESQLARLLPTAPASAPAAPAGKADAPAGKDERHGL